MDNFIAEIFARPFLTFLTIVVLPAALSLYVFVKYGSSRDEISEMGEKPRAWAIVITLAIYAVLAVVLVRMLTSELGDVQHLDRLVLTSNPSPTSGSLRPTATLMAWEDIRLPTTVVVPIIPSVTPLPQPSRTSSPTSSPKETWTPTVPARETWTPTATSTPTASPTSSPTVTASLTAEHTPTPTFVSTPARISTRTATPTPTPHCGPYVRISAPNNGTELRGNFVITGSAYWPSTVTDRSFLKYVIWYRRVVVEPGRPPEEWQRLLERSETVLNAELGWMSLSDLLSKGYALGEYEIKLSLVDNTGNYDREPYRDCIVKVTLVPTD